MEIKQLEYFVTAVDCGSLNQAAQQLYTTQPNVSRVLAGLEKELCTELMVRSSKGISMTSQGELLYSHAMNILKHANIIRSMTGKQRAPRLSISGYRSSILTKLLTEIYQEKEALNRKNGESSLEFEYHEGTMEEITDDVADHVSELGIVYLAERQIKCFQHILEHKKLKFFPLDRRKFCIYMGKHHPLYERESLEFSELKTLKFVGEVQDFFAMEHHIENVSMGEFTTEHMERLYDSQSPASLGCMLYGNRVCIFRVPEIRDSRCADQRL